MDALTVAGKIETLTAMGTAGEWPSSKIRLETTNNVDTTGWQGISFDTSSTDNYGWSIGANRSSNGRGSFRVYEHVNNVTGTERFTILQDGNVGIGTGNPFSALDVNTGTITLREGSTIYHQITSNSDGLNIINNAPAANVTRNIIFKSSVTGGSITEKMRITGAGKVGIGTTDPSEKLEVVGTGHVTSTFSVGNLGATGGMTVTPGGQTDVYALKVARSGSATSVDIWDAGSDSVVIGATRGLQVVEVKVLKVLPGAEIKVAKVVKASQVKQAFMLKALKVLPGAEIKVPQVHKEL